MTIDEAIKHAEEVASKECEDWIYCIKCKEDHKQLAKLLKELKQLREQEPNIRYCKDCKWWKDSDGKYRRGIGAESKCPLNTDVVYYGSGYCYMFEPLTVKE